MKKNAIIGTNFLVVAIMLLGCAHTKPVTASTPILVGIAADGALTVDGQPSDWPQLADRLRAEPVRKAAGVEIYTLNKHYAEVKAAIEACKAADLQVVMVYLNRKPSDNWNLVTPIPQPSKYYGPR